MLTLAFAQISWSIVFQWDAFTGGSNGIVGIWPRAWLAGKTAYYYLALGLCGAGIAAPVARPVLALRLCAARRPRFAAARRGDRHRRARLQWMAFVLVGAFAGVAGALYAFSKGSISPSTHLASPQSVDGAGHGAAGRRRDADRPDRRRSDLHLAARRGRARTEFWRAVLGRVILVLVLPSRRAWSAASRPAQRWRRRAHERASSQVEGLHKAFGGVQAVRRRLLRGRRRRAAGADRPERRRQDHLLQHAERPARARCRHRAPRRPRHRRPAAARRSGASASAAPSRSPRPSPR